MWRPKTAMKPKSRTFAMQVVDLAEVGLLTLHSLSRRFELLQEKLPSEMRNIGKSLDETGTHLQSLSNQLEVLVIVDSRLLGENSYPANLSEIEVTRLLQLNRRLSELEHFFLNLLPYPLHTPACVLLNLSAHLLCGMRCAVPPDRFCRPNMFVKRV